MTRKQIDYTLLKEGFKIHQNRFTKYYYVLTEATNEDGDYQFCTKDFQETAERLCSFLNQLIADNQELYLENQKYKDAIQLAIQKERTQIGQNVLKQLLDSLEEIE